MATLHVYDASPFPGRLRTHNGSTGALTATATTFDAGNDVVIAHAKHPNGFALLTRRTSVPRIGVHLITEDKTTITWQTYDTGISTVSGLSPRIAVGDDGTVYFAIYESSTAYRAGAVDASGSLLWATTFAASARESFGSAPCFVDT
jgi:outer membrane protein assembly factor BamB